MKELQVKNDANGKVVGQIVEVPKPTPGPNDVLIKVAVTGTNPKDWKYINAEKAFNSGDDIAGTVDAVGENVASFRPGDRVAAFHVMLTENGSFAEYAIAPQTTTFHIPSSLSFEDAATIPLVAYTAAISLYQELALPAPWSRPSGESIPLVVYGGSTSVGLTTLKFARLSGFSPLITIAGGSKDIIEKDNLADVIIDYRNNPNIAEDIKKALNGKELHHAFDAFSEHPSAEPLAANLSPNGKLVGILPYKEALSNGHKLKFAYVGSGHKVYPKLNTEEEFKADQDFVQIFSSYLEKLLREGRFKTHPVEVLAGGLNGIPEGLNRLKEQKVKASKLVARISETRGL
ncbi:hypothetical protein TWF569_005517 [Orbilia oligospora]|uniref:Enoyl reductase (ER) domain-containing protein n=1 Tax=Orbilia oligospora TaxID=2813651 RepID=A0A7C8NKN4_ORBOL|nr:hypothetical protein TWF102_011403 [Orbilia oligospora]KAF3115722.1 hypothetical protein TWF706_005830 [Orbilia oligospora]KAF3115723.1 hypothetical protein TWF706_005830 [Orbilia oligospora]KAF3117985.1 hypothetical protein TWF103_000026 [Orbilia oligospora]KAF3141440.1 hypothetical protein TWF594_005997 [Orbilia oligospora]